MKDKKPKILLFVPMYNCEKQIVRVLSRVRETIADYVSEIMIVDNGSKDAGLKAAGKEIMKFKGKAVLVQNVDNYSLGGSHKVAFNYCIDHKFDYCIVLHGDDQADAGDILPYLESGEYKKYDCFLGARFHRDSKLIGYSKFKTFGNIVLNVFISIFTLFNVKDMGSGINMFKASYIKSRHYLIYPNNLTFNVFLLFHAIWSKAQIKFWPISWREFDQVSNAKAFRQAYIIFKLTISYLFSAKKIFTTKSNEFTEIDYRFRVVKKSGKK